MSALTTIACVCARARSRVKREVRNFTENVCVFNVRVCAHARRIPPKCQLCRVTYCDIPGLCGGCHSERHQLPWIPVGGNKLIAFQHQEMMRPTMKAAESEPPSRTSARPHHYLLINIPMSDRVQVCISTITHHDAKNCKVYFGPTGKTDFHSLFWLLKFG